MSPSHRAVRTVGIDPGASTGIVCITLPAQSRDLTRAVWTGSVSVSRRAARKDETHAEAQARFFMTLFEEINNFRPHLVVIEEPADSMVGGWNQQSGTGAQGRQTAFGLGASYMAALAAASCVTCIEKIESYLVAGIGARTGWMPKVKSGNLTHTMKHSELASRLAVDSQRVTGAPLSLGECMLVNVKRRGQMVLEPKYKRDDELMAFGVLRHHIMTVGVNVDENRRDD